VVTASRTRRTLWDAVVGIAAALLVFAAVPGVLAGLVGLPVPHHWTGHDVVSWHGLFDLLAVVSWCAWGGCAWPILRSVAARVRSCDVAPAVRLSDRIAVRITLGVLVLSSFLGLGASIAGASVERARAREPLPASSPALSSPAKLSPAAPSPPIRSPAVPSLAAWLTDASAARANPMEVVDARGDTQTISWVVEAGDTLASLAVARYGSASDWPAIAAANLGRLMHDETRFVDPAVIVPGWTLWLPALDADTDTDQVTVRSGGGAPAASRTPTPELGTVGLPSSAGSMLPLAELAAAGISALVAGLLARRARQLRRLRAFLREEGQDRPAPHEREAELGTLLAPFEHVPLVGVVEAAARHLGEGLATLDPAPGAVQWLRAGRDGVEVHFSEPVPAGVRGWRRTGHATWLLPATVDAAELQHSLAGGEPWCAALLPLGDDDRGTWLLPVAAGSSVAVVGPRAPDLVLAMRAALRTWSWHEALVVTEDVGEATDTLSRAARPSTDVRNFGPRVLFVGDPGALSAAARQACGVLTTRQVDAEIVVVVDDRAASAHPLGLTVRPPLLGAHWKAAVDGLADPGKGGAAARHEEKPGGGAATPSGGPGLRGPSRPLVHRRTAPATLRVVEQVAGSDTTHPDPFSYAGLTGAGAPAPRNGELATPAAQTRGRAEVRLLAAVPGIVGLQAELPPNRARRALELIAYLAMHVPDPVTGDRLRTRVLGSTDVDAAAKTLFNTVGAARRALGIAPDGDPLFPPASRSGHYRLSPLVTVDALRACALVRAGLGSRDPVESVARLREALELVKGEPLGGVLTGYVWWRAEGHERLVADTLVDGACALVRTALDSTDLDLARWALTQARRVEPYSELLTRAAMRVAAASGDARRLQAEWRECQRQIDELDPGGAPSERTERLYALLRAQLAGCGQNDAGQASFAAIDAAPLRSVPSAPSTV
jgi:DNA-binding SARP family transcriptional activator